jgi:hypothetical protein
MGVGPDTWMKATLRAAGGGAGQRRSTAPARGAAGLRCVGDQPKVENGRRRRQERTRAATIGSAAWRAGPPGRIVGGVGVIRSVCRESRP